MRLRPRLTYSNVMVTLLAFVVLCGGAAYAAERLAKNSVGTRQLKNNSVTGQKVKDGSLRPSDFAPSPAGSQGPQGLPGPAGPPGVGHGYQRRGSVNYDKFSSSLYGSEVVSLPVPSGAYFATASVQVQSVNSTVSVVQCRLVDDNGSGGASGEQDVLADSSVDHMTLTALFTSAKPDTIRLQCSKSVPASGARVNEASVTAVQIDGVTSFPE